MKTKILLLIATFVLAGCGTTKLQEVFDWTNENQENIITTIELINSIPFSQPTTASNFAVEMRAPKHVSTGRTSLENPPTVIAHQVIEADLLQASVKELFPNVPVDKLADTKYAIPTYESVLRIISWSQTLPKDTNYVWFSDVSDCDNFARFFREFAKFSLAKSNPEINAELLCAVVWTYNVYPWAGIGSGYHALNLIPCYDVANGTYRILVVEPQPPGIYTDLSLYPNKHYISNIILSGG